MIPDQPAGMTRSALRGRGSGVAVCAAFGALWATWGISTWSAPLRDAGYAMGGLVAGSLLWLALRMIGDARKLSSADDAPASQRRRVGLLFTAIFAAEIVALNIVAWLLAKQNLLAYLMPAIAIIVGLHFYPLASLFRARHYRITATLMTLAGVAGTMAIASGWPAASTAAGVDIVCAITLWTTGFVSWRSTRGTSKPGGRRALPE